MLLHRYLFTLALACVVRAINGSITDYAPLVNQPCPNLASSPLLRVFTPVNQSLHPQEESYINTRLTTVIPKEWKNWISDGSAIGYNLSVLNSSSFPKIGIAISGGGYRAAQYGAGVLSALDARNQSGKAAGTGGLLQVSSYLSGLSGSSWLTGSFYMNDFPTITDLVYGNGNDLQGWLLDIPLFTPDGLNASVFSERNKEFYDSILSSVFAKAGTGTDTSITDLGSRIISYHFLNQTSRANFFTNDTAHGAGQLWSRVPLLPSWQQHLVPFPIIQADSQPVGSNRTTVPPSSTVYEMTPLEFGSWDPQLSAMVNISYVGTHLTNGQPANSTACTTFFDQIGFIMGTSASFFNQIFDPIHNIILGFDNSSSSALLFMLSQLENQFPSRAEGVADWPNPFFDLNVKQSFQDVNSTRLELIDGGSNLEGIPLGQQFVRARGLDVVVAVDASSDVKTNFPNGSSLLLTASRITTLLQSSHQSFPPLPSNTSEFTTTGVNRRPTFFGCFPAQNPPEYPMVIYLPNSPPLNGDSPVTNSSTFLFDYTPEQTQLFLDQAHTNAIGGFTPNSNSPDPNFGKCLQCAAIDRARYKVNPPLARSSFCTQCFQQYCFDPNNLTNSSELHGRNINFVNPKMLSRNDVPISRDERI